MSLTLVPPGFLPVAQLYGVPRPPEVLDQLVAPGAAPVVTLVAPRAVGGSHDQAMEGCRPEWRRAPYVPESFSWRLREGRVMLEQVATMTTRVR